MANPATDLVHVEQRFRRRLLGGVFLVLAIGGLAQRNQRALFVAMDRDVPSETAVAYSAVVPGGGRFGGFGFDAPRWTAPGRPKAFVRQAVPNGGAPGGVAEPAASPSAFVAVPGGSAADTAPGLESPGATSPDFAQTTSDGGFVVNGPAALGGGGSGAAPGGGGGGSPGGGNVIVVPGAVPEPASWLLMILGFGFVGTMLRRRRAASLIGTRVTA